MKDTSSNIENVWIHENDVSEKSLSKKKTWLQILKDDKLLRWFV